MERSSLDALERIVVAGVALTNAALLRARPGLDLSFPQWRVLVVLAAAPDGLPVREISRLIGITLPATGRQLRRLEQRGLVALTPDPRDRRVTRATLTGAGTAAHGSIVADRRQQLSVAIDGGPPDDALVLALEGLAGRMEHRAVSASTEAWSQEPRRDR